MSTIVECAAKGQRKAMESLYESNKRKVYYVALSLVLDEAQAVAATRQVFQTIWNGLSASRVTSEEGFTQLIVQRVVEYCKKNVAEQDPKAFRVPPNKNFLVPVNSVSDSMQDMLAQFPALQRFIFVLHTVGGFDKLQLTRTFKFDLKVINLALEGEKNNVERMLRMKNAGTSDSYEKLVKEFIDGMEKVDVPAEVDRSTAQAIDSIAKPLEMKKQKQIAIAGVAAAALCLCIIIGILIFRGSQYTQTSADNTSGGNGNAIENNNGDVTGTDVTLLDEELTYYADIEIKDYGTITFKLDQESAPITAANFVSLTESGFYDGLTFHRIMEGFMMQGGDPNGNGTGGSDQTIVGEFSANGYDNALSHTRGAVSMARSSAYDSASSQFFIVHEDSTFLDGQYAVFGYVTEGLEVVDAVCEAAAPTDNNGTIPAEEQPVITAITIRTE